MEHERGRETGGYNGASKGSQRPREEKNLLKHILRMAQW